MRGFMVADWPDPAGFWQAISPLLRQSAQAGQPVRIFGEMVSLLWGDGLIDAAIELEALWNELGVQYPFSLLCAYPAQPAACARQLDALTEVCHAHTQVTGAGRSFSRRRRSAPGTRCVCARDRRVAPKGGKHQDMESNGRRFWRMSLDQRQASKASWKT